MRREDADGVSEVSLLGARREEEAWQCHGDDEQRQWVQESFEVVAVHLTRHRTQDSARLVSTTCSVDGVLKGARYSCESTRPAIRSRRRDHQERRNQRCQATGRDCARSASKTAVAAAPKASS